VDKKKLLEEMRVKPALFKKTCDSIEVSVLAQQYVRGNRIHLVMMMTIAVHATTRNTAPPTSRLKMARGSVTRKRRRTKLVRKLGGQAIWSSELLLILLLVVVLMTTTGGDEDQEDSGSG